MSHQMAPNFMFSLFKVSWKHTYQKQFQAQKQSATIYKTFSSISTKVFFEV